MFRIGVGKWLFLVGLNAFFILPFLFPTDIYTPVLRTWRYYVAAYLCIVMGAGWEFRRLRLAMQPIFKTWIAVYAGIVGWMVTQSLIVGEPILEIFWNGLVYLSLIVMALLGQSGTLWKTLNRVFIIHTLAGSIYILQKILLNDITQREELMSMTGFNVISTGSSVIPAALYALPFLIFTFPKQPKLGKLATGLGYLALAFYFIFWQSRIGSILLIILLLISLFILWRGQRLRIFRSSRVMRLIIVTGLILVVLANLTNLGAGLGYRSIRGLSLLTDRWTMGGNILGTTEQDARVLEADVFIHQLRWNEWIAGRGVVAKWQDPRVYEGAVRNMLHIGYLHYLLTGGILLLILMLFPFAWGLRALLKSKSLITMAAGAIWIEYSIMLSIYGFPSASLTWLLLGLALGRCVDIDELPHTLANKMHIDPRRQPIT
jgi:hypothetical protein